MLLTVDVYVICPLKTYVYRKSISGYDKSDDYIVTPTSVKGGQEILYYHGQYVPLSINTDYCRSHVMCRCRNSK